MSAAVTASRAADIRPGQDPAPPALELRDLTVTYGRMRALDGIDLTVGKGEFVALLGPSGCGKTSLLRAAAGYVLTARGAIRIDGREVTMLPPRQRNIGMVFQNYALFPHLSAARNIAFGLRCRRLPAQEVEQRVAEMLAVVGLCEQAERRPSQLSGGQQQRVALARALVIRPDLLLLDEALGALDRKLRVDMQTELRALQRRFGIATLFVTHDQEEAMAMADRIAVIREGRIVQLDTPRDLFLHPRDAWVAEFMGAGNLLRARVGADRGGCRALDLPAGCRFGVAATSGAREGEMVSVFVRADRIRVESPASPTGALRVAARRFLGAQVELHLEAPGLLLRVLLPEHEAASIPIGQAVGASADPWECRILPAGPS